MVMIGESDVHGGPSVPSFTTNPAWNDLGSNQDFFSEKSTTRKPEQRHESVRRAVVVLERSFMCMKSFKPLLGYTNEL